MPGAAIGPPKGLNPTLNRFAPNPATLPHFKARNRMPRTDIVMLALGVTLFIHACWTFIRSRFD
jgi:hypothetical protein